MLENPDNSGSEYLATLPNSVGGRGWSLIIQTFNIFLIFQQLGLVADTSMVLQKLYMPVDLYGPRLLGDTH